LTLLLLLLLLLSPPPLPLFLIEVDVLATHFWSCPRHTYLLKNTRIPLSSCRAKMFGTVQVDEAGGGSMILSAIKKLKQGRGREKQPVVLIVRFVRAALSLWLAHKQTPDGTLRGR
jgi:hypothetical protein